MDSSDKLQPSRSLRLLSPKRNTIQARNVDELIAEQQAPLGIDPSTPFGESITESFIRVGEERYEISDAVVLGG